MNELVFLKKDEPVADSLTVATKFHKKHNMVLRKIEKILSDDSAQNCAQCFKKSNYKDSTGKSNPMYLMNRDGFTFLAMGFTGKEADAWKWKYINAFNTLEAIANEKKTTAWLETRQQGKLTRRAETDVIQQLIEYAKAQGSEHAQMLYMTYSKLAKKFAGIGTRDAATVFQLNNLSLMEHMILNTIQTGMMLSKHYQEIYQDCKRRLEAFSDIAYLENGKMLALQ